MCVYNINNDIVVLDIDYFCDKYDHIDQIIQMEDNNLIILVNNKLKVIKIKKHSFEEMHIFELPISETWSHIIHIIKISNEKICVQIDEDLKIYLYKNNKLIDS